MAAGFNFRFGRTALFVESRYINIKHRSSRSSVSRIR